MKNILFILLIFPSFCFGQTLALDYTASTGTIDSYTFPKNTLSYGLTSATNIRIFVDGIGAVWGSRPYTDFTYNGGSFPSLDSLSSWLNANMFGDTTSGGDTATLESVTTGTGNNVTPNALQVTGFSNINLTLPSTAVFDQGAISGLYRLGATGVMGAVEITDSSVSLGASTASLTVRPQNGTDASVLITGRMQGQAGINATDYAVMSQLLSLGETSTTAYRGDRGKTAYDHSQIVDGTNPHATTFMNIASKPTTLAGYGITNGLAQGGNNFGATVVVGATSNNAVQILANNVVVATFPSTGGFNVSNNNYANATSSNNALLNIGTNGLVLSRNIADANTVAKFNHINASSTGLIADFQKASVSVASVGNTGIITGLSFVKTGGNSAQFLKADGSVDASVYTLASKFVTASSPTLTFGEIPAHSFIDLGLDVTGAAFGDVVTLGIPSAAFVNGAMFNAMVSNDSPGVVTIRCANITASPITIPGGVYKVTIIK